MTTIYYDNQRLYFSTSGGEKNVNITDSIYTTRLDGVIKQPESRFMNNHKYDIEGLFSYRLKCINH